MRRGLLVLPLVLGLAQAAQASAPVRLIEAVTHEEVPRSAVVQIAPLTPEQKANPRFAIMASRLGDALVKAGLNVQQDTREPDVFVLLQYKAVSRSPYQIYGTLTDPAYRAVVVTAIAARPWSESQRVKVLWQTAFDQTGISSDEQKTIPPMFEAGVRWYGRNLTKQGLGPAADCAGSDSTNTGSHISGYCGRTLSPAGQLGAAVTQAQ